ncbi:hypothetical protein BDF20DRAFT_832886 [Mycotypha africana]|uniref:uncharacterized protein n=1 Tax=Mycotypha africana TaxID=64632 RepID=UPI00230076C8|nr:uncharacterized protein BDF20DRAFT_832886 [Mycotypha africana]KAI8988003.1 hypothetical protein BDF20DRAFT_832886 [Mycotypha africana]
MPSPSKFHLKQYKNINEFLAETQSSLHEEEIKNALLLTMSYQIRDNHSNKPYYCGAVWSNSNETKEQQLIFALLAKDQDCLYASNVCDETKLDAINLLIEHLLNTSDISIQEIHAYQPVLQTVKRAIEKHSVHRHIRFQQKHPVWSYRITSDNIIWSKRARELAMTNATELRLATKSDLMLMKSWISAFLCDAFQESNTKSAAINDLCTSMLDLKEAYLLCIEGTPVCMARRLRPLKYSCSLGYVYTPPKYRHKGYAEACVTMTSEILLKSFGFITLFVNKDKDKDDNLYTRIGYKYYGEAGRFILLDK